MKTLAAQYRWIITAAAFICVLAQVGASFEVARMGVVTVLLMMYGVLVAGYLIEHGKHGKFTWGLVLIYSAVVLLLSLLVVLGIYLGI